MQYLINIAVSTADKREVIIVVEACVSEGQGQATCLVDGTFFLVVLNKSRFPHVWRWLKTACVTDRYACV